MMEQRKVSRFTFERALDATLVGIDGTWARKCYVEDFSEAGAKITIDGSLQGTSSSEFFLVLTKMGIPVYRRCERRWVNGEQMGVLFLRMSRSGKLVARSKADHDKAEEKTKEIRKAPAEWLI
jgi:PilZ domain